MAQLSSTQKDELCAELQRLFSAEWHPVDLTKAQLRVAVDVFDEGMETAESEILNSVSSSARTWLLANQTLARFILEEVAQKRREEL
jgi:hypothetical protein